MKKVALLILLSIHLIASNGETVYTQHCATCHTQNKMINMDSMKMKAPPMNMVSMRLKMMLPSKENFVDFVDDYIQNPEQKKGFCMPMAYKRFGMMPPIGKGMSEKERKLVATWLYEKFDGNWGGDTESQSCQNRNKKMKCGGNQKSMMRCGQGKCGR